MKELFKSIDKNCDGSLNLSELKHGLEGKKDKDRLMELLKSADTDGSGEIDYTEFLAACMDPSLFLKEEYLRTAFNMFDKDHNGLIDGDEVNALL